MSHGMNKVISIGNVAADPEVRSFPNGDVVANVAHATSESWIDKSTGEVKERTEWHRVAFFGRVARWWCNTSTRDRAFTWRGG